MAAPESNELRDRPTGDLLKELSDQTTTLVRQEIELAKAELGEKGKTAGLGRACSAAPASSALVHSRRSPPASSPRSTRLCRCGSPP